MAMDHGLPIPAWSARLVSELDANDQGAMGLMTGISPEQINWRPAAGGWSVGQCLEHLCITNETYLRAIVEALKQQLEHPVEKITPGWLARWFIRSFVEPSPNSKRVRAPRRIVPGLQVSASVLNRFLNSNQAYRELIRCGAAYDVNRTRFWNPLIPGIRFTVGTGFEIISGHERRHLLQAKRVKEAADFPL